MEIKANPGRIAMAGTGMNQPVARRKSIFETKITMSFVHTQALKKTLKEIPPARPEKVVLARALAADASYPADEVLRRLADFLAKRINP
jgi:hypothetical protein